MMLMRSQEMTSEIPISPLSPTVLEEVETTSSLVDDQSATNNASNKKLVHLSQTSSSFPPGTNTSIPLLEGEPRKILGHWEGIVTTVEENKFFAAARSLKSDSELPTDEFEIDLARVEDSDIELVHEGAIFYLTVGIRYPTGEGPQDFTQLIFRRMPRWSKQDIRRVEAAADDLWEKLQARRSKKSAENRKIDTSKKRASS